MSEDEPDTEEEDGPKGKIGGEDAWEIEEIIGERYEQKGKRKRRIKYYQVKWKGDYPPDWLHCSRIRAPDLIEKWKEKKEKNESQKEV